MVKKLIYVYCYMKLKDIKLMYRIEGPSLKKMTIQLLNFKKILFY
ncbi:conserved hypothetical protein [Acinetobacter baumannii]|nr:hypothetical protein J801_1922 [Acinetobacter baumannii 45002_8]SYW92444.1 conserved hypothetical protein [Acinetobacter baumannii]